MAAQQCTRSLTCKCPDCAMSMEMFSAKDLIAVASSKVDFTEPADEQAPVGNAPSSKKEALVEPEEKPPAIQEKKRSGLPSMAERRAMMRERTAAPNDNVDEVVVIATPQKKVSDNVEESKPFEIRPPSVEMVVEHTQPIAQEPLQEKKRSGVPSLAERRAMMREKMAASNHEDADQREIEIVVAGRQQVPDVGVSVSTPSVAEGSIHPPTGEEALSTAVMSTAVDSAAVIARWPKESDEQPLREERSGDTVRNPRLVNLVSVGAASTPASIDDSNLATTTARRPRKTGPRSSKLPSLEEYQELMKEEERHERSSSSLSNEGSVTSTMAKEPEQTLEQQQENEPLLSRIVSATKVSFSTLLKRSSAEAGISAVEQTTLRQSAQINEEANNEIVEQVMVTKEQLVASTVVDQQALQRGYKEHKEETSDRQRSLLTDAPSQSSTKTEAENTLVPMKEEVRGQTHQIAQLPEKLSSSQPEAAVVAETVDYSSMPLDQRISNSDWKARKNAFDELTVYAKESFDRVQPYLTQLETALQNEANASALEAVLDCLLHVVRSGPADLSADETARAFKWIPHMTKRCFTGRPATKQRATDVVLELFAVDSPIAVSRALANEVANKNAKVSVGVLAILKDACTQFGAGRVVQAAAIIQAVEQGMAAVQPAIRAEAIGIAIESIHWLGDAFRQALSQKLSSDAQRKELDRRIKEDEESRTEKRSLEPLRHRRDYKQENRSGVGGSSDVGDSSNEVDGNAGVDVYDLLAPNDILPRIEKLDLEKRLKEPKWSERKSVLAEAEAMCGKPPKLVQGDYAPLLSILRKTVINDSHQSVVIQALQCLGAISEGLRSGFAPYGRPLMAVLLEKLKDQKKPVTAAADAVLDSVARWSVCIGDDRSVQMLQEVMASPKSTPLQVKNILHFLERSCKDGKVLNWPQFQGDLEPLAQVVRTKAAHPDPAVRQGVAAALDAMRGSPQTLAESTMSTKSAPMPSTVPASSRTAAAASSRVGATTARTALTSARPSSPTTVGMGARSGVGSTRPASPTTFGKPATTGGVRRNSFGSVGAAPRTGASSTLGARRDSTGSVTGYSSTGPGRAAQASASTRASMLQASGPPAPVKAPPMSASEEMLDALVRTNAPLRQALQAENVSSRWEERYATLIALNNAVRTFPLVRSDDGWELAQLDAIAVLAGSRTRDFADANSEVMEPAWELARFCAQRSTGSCEYLESIVLSCAASKLADKKQNSLASLFLLDLAASFNGPAWVMTRLLRCSRGAGSTKTKQAIYDWLSECVQQFGIDQLVFDPRKDTGTFEELVKFICSEEGVASSSLEVRGSAVSLLGEFCKQMGAPNFQRLAYVPPSISQEVQRRVAGAHVLQPNRVWRFMPERDDRGDLVVASALLEGSKPQDISAELEPLIPVLSTTDAPSWKKREDALVQLERILTPKRPIQVSKTVRDLAIVLGKRLDDTQRNVAARAAMCIGILCECIGGNASAQLVKAFGERLLLGLGDSKKNVAQASQTALTLCVCHQGKVHAGALMATLSLEAEVLAKGKCDKSRCLAWACDRIEERWEQQDMDGDFTPLDQAARQVFLEWLPLLVASFTAKEAQARRSSMRLAELMVAQLPEQIAAQRLRSHIRDLKLAEQRIVTPIVEEVLVNSIPLRLRRENGLQQRTTGGVVLGGPTTPPESTQREISFVTADATMAQRMAQARQLRQENPYMQQQRMGASSSERAHDSVQERRSNSGAPVLSEPVTVSDHRPSYREPVYNEAVVHVQQQPVEVAEELWRAPERNEQFYDAIAPAVAPTSASVPLSTPKKEAFDVAISANTPMMSTPMGAPYSFQSPPANFNQMTSTTSFASLVESWEAESGTCRELLREEIYRVYHRDLAEKLFTVSRKNLLPALDVVFSHKDLIGLNPVPFLLWTTIILKDEPTATPLFRGLLDSCAQVLSATGTLQRTLNTFEVESFVRYVIPRFNDPDLTSSLKEKLFVLLRFIPQVHPIDRYLSLLFRYVAATQPAQLNMFKIKEACLTLATMAIRSDSSSALDAMAGMQQHIAPLLQNMRKQTQYRPVVEEFILACEDAASPGVQLAQVREWFSSASLTRTPRTPPSPVKAATPVPVEAEEVPAQAREVLDLLEEVRGLALLLDQAPAVGEGDRRESVALIRGQKTCTVLIQRFSDVDDYKFERLMEDHVDTSAIGMTCAVILERLALKRSNPPDQMWRKASPCVQLCRSLVEFINALLSKRALRYQCNATSVSALVSSLLLVHARVKQFKDLPLTDRKLGEMIEQAFFGPLSLTPQWLPVVLSLDPAPVEFVQRGLEAFAVRLEQDQDGDDELFDSVMGADLPECVRLAKRTTWVPLKLIRVLETFAPTSSPLLDEPVLKQEQEHDIADVESNTIGESPWLNQQRGSGAYPEAIANDSPVQATDNEHIKEDEETSGTEYQRQEVVADYPSEESVEQPDQYVPSVHEDANVSAARDIDVAYHVETTMEPEPDLEQFRTVDDLVQQEELEQGEFEQPPSVIEFDEDEKRLAELASRIGQIRAHDGSETETLAAINDLVEFKRQRSHVFDFDVALLFPEESDFFVKYLKEKLREADSAVYSPDGEAQAYDIQAGLDRVTRIAVAMRALLVDPRQ